MATVHTQCVYVRTYQPTYCLAYVGSMRANQFTLLMSNNGRRSPIHICLRETPRIWLPSTTPNCGNNTVLSNNKNNVYNNLHLGYDGMCVKRQYRTPCILWCPSIRVRIYRYGYRQCRVLLRARLDCLTKLSDTHLTKSG